MSDLVEFLLARIAEDEEAGREFGDDGTVGTWSHWVLAECDAKRLIIEQYQDEHAKARPQLPSLIPIDTSAGGALGWVLKALATVYADHPDYRQEWKP